MESRRFSGITEGMLQFVSSTGWREDVGDPDNLIGLIFRWMGFVEGRSGFSRRMHCFV